MIKRILVPLDGSSFSESTTRHACDVAQRTGAEVFGQAVDNDRKASSTNAPFHALAARWPTQSRHQDWKDDKCHLGDALEQFDRICNDAGVPHRQARLQGVPANMVIEQSIFYDLLVTGFQGDYGAAKEGENSVRTLLGTSITPVLVVPREYREIKTVLVCFDGSLPAMRSLQDFAVLAGVSQFEITILTAEKDDVESRYLLRRASDYLRSYGVDHCHTVAEPGPIAELVQEASFFDPTDLVVAGIHTRHAVRDYFLGSLVLDLLKLGRVPLFLGQ